MEENAPELVSETTADVICNECIGDLQQVQIPNESPLFKTKLFLKVQLRCTNCSFCSKPYFIRKSQQNQ